MNSLKGMRNKIIRLEEIMQDQYTDMRKSLFAEATMIISEIKTFLTDDRELMLEVLKDYADPDKDLAEEIKRDTRMIIQAIEKELNVFFEENFVSGIKVHTFWLNNLIPSIVEIHSECFDEDYDDPDIDARLLEIGKKYAVKLKMASEVYPK